MEDRIQINGVWYKREKPETPKYEITDRNITSSKSYTYESTDFCFEAIKLSKDEGEVFFDTVDIEFTDKRVKPWKEEYWDNNAWMLGILEDKSIDEAKESMSDEGINEFKQFIRVLIEKGWFEEK